MQIYSLQVFCIGYLQGRTELQTRLYLCVTHLMMS
jgi:hypothetical protein